MNFTSADLTVLISGIAVVGTLIAAFVSFRRVRSDIRSTNATATKSGAEAASILNDSLVIAAKRADASTARADAATRAMEDALHRLSAVMRIADEIPDHIPFGTVRERIITALRQEGPPYHPGDEQTV